MIGRPAVAAKVRAQYKRDWDDIPALVSLWLAAYGTQEIKLREVALLCRNAELLVGTLRGTLGTGTLSRLAAMLTRTIGLNFSGYTIKVRRPATRTKVAMWRLDIVHK